jgi:hypothetical protein
MGEREALDIISRKHPAAGRRVLILLGCAARREPEQADVYQERTLGFCGDNRTSRKSAQVDAKSHD